MTPRPYGRGLTEPMSVRLPKPLAERIRRSALRQNLSISEWFRLRSESYLDVANPGTLHERKENEEANLATLIAEGADPVGALRSATRELTGKSAPNEPVEPERWFLPHLVQEDGDCAGGCNPTVDETCLVGPDDSRRTGKRVKR